jgi:hypothetical protein
VYTKAVAVKTLVVEPLHPTISPGILKKEKKKGQKIKKGEGGKEDKGV